MVGSFGSEIGLWEMRMSDPPAGEFRVKAEVEERLFWLDVLGVLEFVSRGADHANTRPFPDVQARRALGYLHEHPELPLGDLLGPGDRL